MPPTAELLDLPKEYGRATRTLARRLDEAAQAKYGYGQDPGAYQGALGRYPRRVRAWTAFPRDATRFRFA
jgi:hypothetical protein